MISLSSTTGMPSTGIVVALSQCGSYLAIDGCQGIAKATKILACASFLDFQWEISDLRHPPVVLLTWR